MFRDRLGVVLSGSIHLSEIGVVESAFYISSFSSKSLGVLGTDVGRRGGKHQIPW